MRTTDQLFTEMQQARNAKEMKTFVSNFKNEYNISLSIRDIRTISGYNENVYNDLEKFRQYLLIHGMHDLSPKTETPKTETPKTETPKTETPKTETPKTENDLVKALKAAIGSVPIELDEARVIELIKENARTETIYINKEAKREVKLKLKHKQFDAVLALISSGVNVWITGGAGGGKTHAVGDVAKVLGLDFYTKSISSQTSEFSFFGFMNASGSFVETDFYKAYTKGGVFCIDEIDNGSPNLLSVLNSALANGKCSFANGVQNMHEDFIVVATANTTGRGGNQKYVGRLQIGADTLDRFGFLHWEYDNELEKILCGNEKVATEVQKLRAKAEKMNLNCVISPRASIMISKLVAAGMDTNDAFKYAIFNKLTTNEINILNS